jgi:hypothetical protein
MGSEPKPGVSHKPLVDLDDPDEIVALEAAPHDTARPDFEPDKFAKELEHAADRMTQPPVPTYEMLRDSCKTSIAAEAALDEEQILSPSKKYKAAPR